MELALVRTLSRIKWERLRQQSIELCASFKQTIRRTQERRARHRLVLQGRHTTALGWIIRSKIEGGRLPRVWPLILSVDFGAGGMCDACDKPLLRTQVVMALRGRDAFVRLHSECFLLWEDVRNQTAKTHEPLASHCRLPV